MADPVPTPIIVPPKKQLPPWAIGLIMAGIGIVSAIVGRNVAPPAPPKPAPVVAPGDVSDPDMKAIKSWIDTGNSDAATRHKETLDTSAKQHAEMMDALKQLLPKPPTPVDDAIIFDGPTTGQVNQAVKVKVKLGKNCSSLTFGPAPGTTANVTIIGDTAVVVPKDATDIYLQASAVRDGKIVGPLQWRITVNEGPNPPPTLGLSDDEKKELATLVAAFPDAGARRASVLLAKAAGVDLGALPTPPTPVDAFTKSVQDAWVLDGRNPKVSSLASLYKASPAIVNDPANTKYKDILDKMHAAAQAPVLLGEPDPTKVTVLVNVRRVLANEFNTAIGGKTGTPLDATSRALIVAEFAKAQKALEACK